MVNGNMQYIGLQKEKNDTFPNTMKQFRQKRLKNISVTLMEFLWGFFPHILLRCLSQNLENSAKK